MDASSFWHPTNTAVTVLLPWSFKNIDSEYIKQTGNILGVAATTTDVIISKVIIDRPGLDLIAPTAETITNHPPEITGAAAFNGTTLAVTASDADGDPLTYDVLATDALVSNIWINTTEETGSVALDAEFESVTNRVSIDTQAHQFMKLEIGVGD